MSKHRVDEALGGAHVDFDTGKTHPHIPGGVIDLRKPRPKSAGEVLDESAKRPMLTPEDLNYETPLGDKVFVQTRQPAARSPGGIMLPDTSQPVPTQGVVIAVGPGNHTISGVLVPISLKVGDEVRFVAQAFGGGIRINGHFVLPMTEHDIFSVRRPPEA